MKMTIIQKICNQIQKARSLLVASHYNPEGDALGSALAIYHHFGNDKKIQVFNQDPVPYFLEFLPGSEKIIHSLEQLDPDFEIALVVDCTDLMRVNKNFHQLLKGKTIINIDHHETNKYFGELNLVQPDASSTGEIIFQLLSRTGQKFNPQTATCLYTALMMDTGSFRYSNTSPSTLKIASRLVALGANPSQIAKKVYENHPPSWLKLLALALSTVSINQKSRYAEMTLTREMLKKTGATKEMSEGLINYMMMIKGIEVAVLYRETAPQRFKVSFRSAGKVNVAKLCESLGGGGHHQAAGVDLEGELKSIKTLIRKRLDQILK